MNARNVKISAVLAGIVLVGSAMSVVDKYRLWASAEELERVARVSYSTAIAWEQQELDDTLFLLDQCEIKRDCSQLQIQRLKRRLREKEEKLDELKREREQSTKE